MNNILSIKLDFPEPFGPTIEVKFLWNGPIFCVPAYDLKFFNIIWSIIRRGLFSLTKAKFLLIDKYLVAF